MLGEKLITKKGRSQWDRRTRLWKLFTGSFDSEERISKKKKRCRSRAWSNTLEMAWIESLQNLPLKSPWSNAGCFLFLNWVEKWFNNFREKFCIELNRTCWTARQVSFDFPLHCGLENDLCALRNRHSSYWCHLIKTTFRLDELKSNWQDSGHSLSSNHIPVPKKVYDQWSIVIRYTVHFL